MQNAVGILERLSDVENNPEETLTPLRGVLSERQDVLLHAWWFSLS